ncbi:MAG: type II toxin-antitoxin system VapC family toxin [Acidimicrobiales bacterium]
MTLVVDASVVVAALVDDGPHGRWADALLSEHALAAPHLLPVEAASVLRRASWAGTLTTDTATLAHFDLLDLRVELFPYEPFAERVWDLRTTVTSYDAWHVALAEQLAAPFATLDRRLARAPGPRCAFVVPAQDGG